MAASLVFGGLAARLVAPVLAVAVLHGRLPGLDPDTLSWRPWTGGVVPLRATDPRGHPAGPGTVPAAVLGPSLALADVLRERTRVSRRLLHGEVAVAVAKVARVLARERPGAAGAALATATELLGRAPLAGAADLLTTGDGPVLRRRTCCLAYRVPGGRACADCPLDDRAPRTHVTTD